MASDCIEYKQVVRTYKKQSSEIVVRNGNIEYAAVSLHIEIHFIDIFAINNIIHKWHFEQYYANCLQTVRYLKVSNSSLTTL